MVEKEIKLENIALIDFLGVDNQNIKELSKSFPESKIVSRGSTLTLQGKSGDLAKISQILDSLISHYHKVGKITPENIENILKDRPDKNISNSERIVYGISGNVIKPRTVNQQRLVKSVAKNDLVFAVGPAGTGKTFVSVALAVRALKEKKVKKIIMTRPAVEAGENLGFLPGDLKDKVDPYLRPIYDALHDMIPGEKLNYYMENNIIEVAPLAYMRGRTLENAFVLLDEAQNTTTQQMKMFLTRMGTKSKVVVTGDISQIDLPKHQKSGLKEAIEILKGTDGIGFVHLDSSDVVRHTLVKKMIDAYDKATAEKLKDRKDNE